MKRLDLLEEKFNFEGKIKKYVFGYQTMVMGPPGGFANKQHAYTTTSETVDITIVW